MPSSGREGLPYQKIRLPVSRSTKTLSYNKKLSLHEGAIIRLGKLRRLRRSA